MFYISQTTKTVAQKRTQQGEETISVREANQGFSKLIARVESGERFIVTKNNRPVARIAPAEADRLTIAARRKAAIHRLNALMKTGGKSKDGWTYKGDRDSLHERDL